MTSSEVFEQGKVDWIQRPFDMDDLAAKIRAVLAGKVSPVQSRPVEEGP